VGGGRASWQLAPRTRPGVGGAVTGGHRMDWKEQKSTELTEVVPLRLLCCLLLECLFFATLGFSLRNAVERLNSIGETSQIASRPSSARYGSRTRSERWNTRFGLILTCRAC